MPFKSITGGTGPDSSPSRPAVKPKGPVDVNKKPNKPIQTLKTKSLKDRLVKGGRHY